MQFKIKCLENLNVLTFFLLDVNVAYMNFEGMHENINAGWIGILNIEGSRCYVTKLLGIFLTSGFEKR